MEDCLFCRIARHELPSRIIYEDPWSMVFLDIAGNVDGHMVVIPKTHTEHMMGCPPEELSRVILAIQKVSQHCINACGYDGVNLLHASGDAAGQSISHLHFHLIPRKLGDGIDAWPKFPGSQRTLDEVFQKLKG